MVPGSSRIDFLIRSSKAPRPTNASPISCGSGNGERKAISYGSVRLCAMAITADNVSLSLPVEIGKIDRELKKLWAEGGGAKTRASLINLAVYSEAPGSLSKNTQIVSEITEDHACRAIVIAANPASKENNVEAWINVHCHVSRAGSKQVCSEQLSFLLEGPC